MIIYTDFEYAMDFSLTSQQKREVGGMESELERGVLVNTIETKTRTKKRQMKCNYLVLNTLTYQQKNISINSKKNKKILKEVNKYKTDLKFFFGF